MNGFRKYKETEEAVLWAAVHVHGMSKCQLCTGEHSSLPARPRAGVPCRQDPPRRLCAAAPVRAARTQLCLLKHSLCAAGKQESGRSKNLYGSSTSSFSHMLFTRTAVAAVRSCLLQGQMNSLLGRAEGLAGWMTGTRCSSFFSLMLPGAPRATNQAVAWPHRSLALGTPGGERQPAEGEPWKKAFGLYLYTHCSSLGSSCLSRCLMIPLH